MPSPDYRTKHFRKRTDDTPRSTLPLAERTIKAQRRFVIRHKSIIAQKLKLK